MTKLFLIFFSFVISNSTYSQKQDIDSIYYTVINASDSLLELKQYEDAFTRFNLLKA